MASKHPDHDLARSPPPPLPPRNPGAESLLPTEPPPPYTPYPSDGTFTSHDPRTSSTQSLVPSDPHQDGKRRLLLIYIHGFMGDETSFQSFPAHVHNLLSITLADTHTIHTKIYPKYRSRRAIEFARDDFSTWLAPHENPMTDVILLGHSMGGLLSAEVALFTCQNPSTGHQLRHRIVGTISFDTPFLGMHIGVVVSGINSLFRPAESPDQTSQSQQAEGATQGSSANGGNPTQKPSSFLGRVDTLFSKPNDPYYNPAFPNDIRLPVRKGWGNTLHFVVKHADNLFSASKQYVSSHLEFGGAMADYPSLRQRYARIRALEERDETARRSAIPSISSPPRVRFLNYYTASTGRPPKSEKSLSPSGGETSASTSARRSTGSDTQNLNLSASASASTTDVPLLKAPSTQSVSPRISLEEHHDDEVIVKEPEIPSTPQEPFVTPALPGDSGGTLEDGVSSSIDSNSHPPIPPVPELPSFVNPELYSDKQSLKQAEQEHAQALKAYKQAVKERNKIIKSHEKLLKKAEKEQRKLEKKQQKPTVPDSVSPPQGLDTQEPSTLTDHHPSSSTPDQLSLSPSAAPFDQPDASMSPSPPPSCNAKQSRDKKFCTLPPKDPITGERDPTWVRVYMEGVDEVGAHCGLFFLSETYERLVGDVASRIEEWVTESSFK